MRVVVRLLGPLEVECAGRRVSIGAAKERVVVVVLALNAGRVVPIERLVDAVWGGDPPESASTTVRVLVSRLRKALAGAGCRDVITTRAPGYLMAAHLVDVDVHRFQALTADGRARLAAGSAAEAATMLREALALWRGDQLAESGGLRLTGEAAGLAEARLATLEARIDADLATGGHAGLVGELEELCQGHRLRERLWGQRMLALYRCGRQADALAAYRQLRSTLADELGLDPTDQLRRLEGAILAQDPALTPPTPTAARSPVDRAETPVSLPTPLTVTETVPCVGREAQLETLREAWRSVLRGAPRLVLVRGEAGVGKTRLMREFSREVHAQGAIVLHGRCDEDIAIPFRPIRECLTHYLTSVPEVRLAGHDRQRLGEISRVIPELAGLTRGVSGPTRTDPMAERYLLYSAVAGLLGEIASETPVVLVFDDLQWADRPTLLLLRHLAGTALGRVMVLAAYRDEDLSVGQSLTDALAALCREPTVGHLRLEPLTETAVAAVMAAMAGGALDAAGQELARDLVRDTDGNAFLVVEQVRHLWETGTLIQVGDGHATAVTDLATAGLPHTVQQVVAGRLGRLGDQAGTVLAAASAIGEQFDLDLLAAATRSDEDRVLDVLDAGGQLALVAEAVGRAGTFRFAHDMVRQVIYQRLGPTRQARLHARIGEALENLCGHDPGERAAELARHLLAGRPTNAIKAVRYARLAGERALAALAPDEAVRWFSQAIEALNGVTDDRERLRCQVGLGDAHCQLGLPTGRTTLLDAARQAHRLGEIDLLVRAALANNRGFFGVWGQVDVEQVTTLEAALDLCPPDSPQRARLLSRLAAELTFHPDASRRRAIADEAVAVARRSGDVAALLDALIRPGPALIIPELSDLRLSRFREAQTLADRVDDPVIRFWTAHQLGVVLQERADPDGVDQAFGHAEQIATKIRQPVLHAIITMCRCWQALLAGDVGEAERLAHRMLQLFSGQPDADVHYCATLVFIRWHQGRLDETIPILTKTTAENPDDALMRVALAFAEALGGQPEQARRLLRAAADAGFTHPRTTTWLITTCTWAEVAAELGDQDAARVLYERLLPWHDLFATTAHTPLHCVAHSLGRLAALQGRLQDAENHYAEALTVHRRMRAPFLIAATQLAWGRLLLPDDPDRAGPLLVGAASIAARHGYRNLQRAARACRTSA